MGSKEFEKEIRYAAGPAMAFIESKPQVFDITAEAKATAHGRGDESSDVVAKGGTTLTHEQFTKYQEIMELYRHTKDRKAPNYKGFTKELENLGNLPAEDRAAIQGRLVYQGARSTANKGNNLIADVLAYSPGAKELTFKGQDGKDVSLREILEKGINVNTDAVRSAAYDIPKSDTRFDNIQAIMKEIESRNAAPAKVAGKTAGHTR